MAKSRLGEVLASVGDVDPISYGGGLVFATDYGPSLEYTSGSETDGEDLEVYRVPVESSVLEQFDNLLKNDKDLDNLCTCICVEISDWKVAAQSDSVAERAQCILDIASYYGWHELDQYPLSLSERQLHSRWYS